jgi:DNA invertase Pin-like site-specific DNA recombinase
MNIGYARVSTKDQDLHTQLEMLTQAGCTKVYSDKQSGKSMMNRPELQKLMEQLREGDTIVVTSLTRLSREPIDALQFLSTLNQTKAKFRCLDFPMLDSESDLGQVFLTVFSAFTKYYRQDIIKRSKLGQAQAKANGVHIGRKAGVDEVSFAKVRKAYDLGLSVAETVRMTGVSESSVKRYRKQL